MGKPIEPAPELALMAADLIGGPEAPHKALQQVRLLWALEGATEAEGEDAGPVAHPVRVTRVKPSTVVLLGQMDASMPVFEVVVDTAFWHELLPAQRPAVLDYALCHITRTFSGAWKLERDPLRVLYPLLRRERDLTWIRGWDDFADAAVKAGIALQMELPLFGTDKSKHDGTLIPNVQLSLDEEEEE